MDTEASGMFRCHTATGFTSVTLQTVHILSYALGIRLSGEASVDHHDEPLIISMHE